MKKIAAIILKDTLVRFASPSEWLFFILLPILFTVILGSSTGSMSDTRIVLPVVDQAQTDLSAQLVAALDKSSSVRVVAEDLSKAQSDFDSRRNSAVLIIPAGFNLDAQSKNSLSLKILQQPNNMDALISEQAVPIRAQPPPKRSNPSPMTANGKLTTRPLLNRHRPLSNPPLPG
jgi:ABC-2 type transport system permease protein